MVSRSGLWQQIPFFATVGATGFDVVGLLAMIAFFVAYGTATHSFDRLIIGAIRALLSE